MKTINKSMIIDLIYQLKMKCMITDQDFSEELNITYTEYQFFLAIQYLEELNCNNLCKYLNLSYSRISRIIENMYQKGYINRKSKKNDRRCIELSLTLKGKSVLDKIIENRIKCEQKLLDNITISKLEEIKENISLIISLLIK